MTEPVARPETEEDPPISEAVVNAELPPQSIEETEQYQNSIYTRFGELFKSREDSDYFCMLPISNKQRLAVLKTIQKKI